MIFVLGCLAIPANLLGLISLVTAFFSRRTGLLTTLAIFTVMAATATSAMTLVGGLHERRVAELALEGVDEESRATIRAQSSHELRQLALGGVAVSALPWLGGLAAAFAARRQPARDDD